MLNPDFRDILSELSAADAEYLIVDAFAMAAHGMPRATGDLDLWVRPECGSVAIPVLSRRHLLINKRASGRPRDLADAAWIEEQGID